MTTSFSIQDLIHHFEARQRQIDRLKIGDVPGGEPQFPQLVVYLGSDAMDAHQVISTNLLQIWPQYESELKFLGISRKTNSCEYYELACDDKESKMISADEVREMVSSLFGTKMHFADRSQLLVYYILDTTSFRQVDDFRAWITDIAAFKKLINADTTSYIDVLTLLLNENLVRQKISAEIRNILGGFYDGNEVRKAVSNVLLLSNRRSDNAILEDWSICYAITSAAIVLSNNPDPLITTSFFGNNIITASYAREEKPLQQIGQVVAKSLLVELENNSEQTEVKLLDDIYLPDRLGLTKDGTFSILDQYAETQIFEILPTEEQLELFPRKDTDDRCRLASLSAREFNEYTMGAWDAYLTDITRDVREKISLDSNMRKIWCDKYTSNLVNTFNKSEIRYLAEHLSDLEELMCKSSELPQDAQVLIAAREQLKRILSDDRELIRVFLKALGDQGEKVNEYTKTWDNLIKSMRTVHTIRDNNISTFYDRKVRNFCDHHGTEMRKEFESVRDASQLVSFLNNYLDRIIDSDEVFSAAFEEELECRLNEDALPVDAKQYIRSKLTGDGVFTYLQTNFSMGEPIVSSIFLKHGTPLHKSLYASLAPTTHYYSTGNSSVAESLVLYTVSKINLVNGEA